MEQHKAVLLTETIDALVTNPGGKYIDATFGRGGHSRALLARLDTHAQLLVIDQDHAAIEQANLLAEQDKRVMVKHGNFAQLDDLIVDTIFAPDKLDGILMDIGVCSSHLDQSERGFSFLRSGPLDMRMDQSTALTARELIASADADKLTDIFKRYGEERFSKRIAGAIVNVRKTQEIITTVQLASIVSDAHPRWEKHKHPATRVFQALRIYINDELQALADALPISLNLLNKGGRLAVISFHSLEDRIVKRFIAAGAKGDVPDGLPVVDAQIKRTCKKVITARASLDELAHNPRSRSATLRVAEKL